MFYNQNSKHLTNFNLKGNVGGNAGFTVFVPNFYFSSSLNDKLSFGIGINAPFGFQTEYDKNWIGRYYAIKSALKTLNINPSIAYKLTEQLSVGVGVNFGVLYNFSEDTRVGFSYRSKNKTKTAGKGILFRCSYSIENSI